MAAFDDASWFEDSILNFDANHLAPSMALPPPDEHAGPSSNRNSLSPMPSLHHTATTSESSPRSYGTGSPASSASFLNTSFSESELDELLNLNYGAGAGMMDQQQQQHQQPLFLPPNTFGGYDFNKMSAQMDPFAGMFFQPPPPLPQQQLQQQQQTTMAPQWMQQSPVVKQETQAQPETLSDIPAVPVSATSPAAPAPAIATKAPAKRGPKPKKDKDSTSPDGADAAGAPGGKHNKTERRYRQKVQAAQSDLRDSVPALRVLYGTSSDEQKRTTDIKAADGSVDGLGEITRPNASAKTTIFVGARMYIELLQQRVASQQRRIDELEQYRASVGGQAELDSWKADFETREAAMQEILKAAAAAALQESEEDEDEQEEEEEDEPTPPPAKRKRGRKPKDQSTTAAATTGPTANSTAGAAVRVFAAFAMTFSLLPLADKTFTSVPLSSASSPLSDPSTGQVISQLPIITAEHTSRLLARGLPSAIVPGPTALVEWTWRILVGVVFAVILGRLTRLIKPRVGVTATLKEGAKYAFRVESPINPAVLRHAGTIVGGGAVPSASASTWSRRYTILHLNRTASSDPYALAILALLQPQPNHSFLPSSETVWKQARASISESTPSSLILVLDLSLAQVRAHLEHVGPTSDPIGVVADQIHLGHLDDLYSQLFTKIVNASTSTSSPTARGATVPSTTRTLRDNLVAYKMAQELKTSAFELEIRRTLAPISRGSSAHALGLVLVGLWGVLAGSAPAAQASLTTALAAAEMHHSSSSLSSVSAMLNLLYPGTSSPSPSFPATVGGATARAAALDKMAVVCIEYLRLVASPSTSGPAGAKGVAAVTTNLRLALTQTDSRLHHPASNKEGQTGISLMRAKEQLVGVLSAVGRRAAGRMTYPPEDDSGLDAEVDEL